MVVVLFFAATPLLLGIAGSFWAGCTADLKGGTWGAPQQALNIQGMAALLLLVGSVKCAATMQARAGTRRPWIGAAMLLGILALFGAFGFQTEVWGTQFCSPG